jgi:hypothetical protein
MKSKQKVSKQYTSERLLTPTLNEMKIEFNAFYQSKLAISILKDKSNAHSVTKIAQKIGKLLEANKAQSICVIESDVKIKADLYGENIYGRLPPPTLVSTYKQIVDMVNNPQSKIEQLLLIQCVFIHRIYDHLSQKNTDNSHTDYQGLKQSLVTQLFPDQLFNDRGRSKSEDKISEETKNNFIKKTDYAGINNNKFFITHIKKYKKTKPHLRAKDVIATDEKSAYYQRTQQKLTPYVAGASGHTGSLLLGAKLYGDLCKDELKAYALTIGAYFIAGGNHSYDEVMIVADQLNIERHTDEELQSMCKDEDQYKYATLNLK